MRFKSLIWSIASTMLSVEKWGGLVFSPLGYSVLSTALEAREIPDKLLR